MSKDVAGSNPAMCNIHRSLMDRMAGFHPADPGSIPGDEDHLSSSVVERLTLDQVRAGSNPVEGKSP